MRNLIFGVVAATMAVPAVTVPTIGSAAYAYDHRDRYRGDRYYDRRGYYNGPRWRGRDGRYRCRRSNGTTGLLIGGAAGALLGREIDGGRDRTTGTILGAAAGALLGREIDRGGSRCR
ncbi:glycine zipper 2TM domain-containing protein [Sphingosinicella sp. LHD-64]|uniref:glycine zipper 2TM domain-containing protein n=1 Tax=Sphingosinicella sp. LHD-64 TaxID=3072139 RepID=UPI00280D0AE7|nr:glycine zipper 2TM domain-containing protein [Sphingosinicella sp. LHD-64]MDQ8754723.1 glycine zipper 2TM domain-containing protein [Sphingosinicella sp. LHD-64]